MAEEVQAAAANAERAPKSGGGMLKMLVIVGVLAMIGMNGFICWNLFVKDSGGEPETPAVTEKPAQSAAAQVPPGSGIVFPLRSFIVNLMDKAGVGKKYLKVTIEIEVPSEKDKEAVGKYTAQITDVILMLLSSQTLEEINTLEGKIALKQALMMRMNRVLGGSVVRRIYFTEFVIQ